MCQFNAAAKMNKFDIRQKAINLLLSLKGKAADIFRSLPDGKEEDFHYLKNVLASIFGEQHLQLVHQLELMNKFNVMEKVYN